MDSSFNLIGINKKKLACVLQPRANEIEPEGLNAIYNISLFLIENIKYKYANFLIA